MLYSIYCISIWGLKMFEAKCDSCEAVYSTEESCMPESFECMCGSCTFKVQENTLLVA